MGRFKDLTDNRIGKWLVIERAPNSNVTQTMWLCRCDCGTVKPVSARTLVKGESTRCKSCVNRKESNRGINITHGHSANGRRSPTYIVWVNMKRRCLDPKNAEYWNYGGRGITICERWLIFENFLADMGDRPEGLTLDRIDSNGNYERDNCRWADRVTQSRNTRHCVIDREAANEIKRLRAEGQLTRRQIAAQFGVHKSTVDRVLADTLIGLQESWQPTLV